MQFDITKAGAVIGPARFRPSDRTAHGAPRPHLVLLKPSPVVPRQTWVATVGNTLLEAPWLAWSAFDALLMVVGVYLGYSRFVWRPDGGWMQIGFVSSCVLQCASLLLAGLVFGLYEQQTLLRGSRIVARSLLTAAATLVLPAVTIHLFAQHSVQSRAVLVLAIAVYLCTSTPARLLVGWAVRGYSRKFVIVGTDRRSWVSPATPGEGLSRRYQLVGYVSTDAFDVMRETDGHRVLGTVDDLERICVENDVREIVVGPLASRNTRVLEKALSCLKLGCRVTNYATFYEQVMSEVPIAHLEPNWFLFADLKHYREAQLIMKRAFDLLGSIFGLALTLPFWPLIALLIRLDSAGPVFYHQERVGLNGCSFRLHKFRTMTQQAEAGGHVWAAQNDPRVTRIGRYLRRTRLDELPQLWNILLGQMSIVGPRPERPEFVEELAGKIRFYQERHLIKPGLTGWAQINYRYGASVDDARRKLQLDLWYLKHMSIELDVIILLRTLGTMCLGSR